MNFADSFLNLNTLTDEVTKEIFKLPRLALIFTILGLIAAFLSIFVPIAISVWSDGTAGKVTIGRLERRVEQLEEADKKREKTDTDVQVELRARSARDGATPAEVSKGKALVTPVEPEPDTKRNGK